MFYQRPSQELELYKEMDEIHDPRSIIFADEFDIPPWIHNQENLQLKQAITE